MFVNGGLLLLERYLAKGFVQKRPKCTQAIKRYLILDLAENHYVDAKGRTQLEKVQSLFPVSVEKTHADVNGTVGALRPGRKYAV